MKQRIITAVVAFVILVPVLIFAWTPVLPIAISLCSILAIYEMLSCIGLKKSVVVSLPFYLCAAAFPILIRYLNNSVLLHDIVIATLSVCVLYLFAVLVFSHGKYTFEKIGGALLSALYIILGFSGIIYIYRFEPGGQYVYLMLFLGAWVTDIFAYFCGIFLGRGGKHKLIPDVSPKKTVEGSIGGIFFCIAFMVGLGAVLEALTPYHANLLVFAVAGLAASIVSQIGDLSMSVIKRTFGIKDYGKIFPGHGGILDRFDSTLAVSIALMVFTRFFDLLN